VSWTIYWSEAAEGELDEILSIAPDPPRFLVACTQLEQEVMIDPVEAGESRTANYRVIICLPAVAYFVVHPQQEAIQITHVRAVWKPHQR
jgi:hypothetical protein